MKYLPKRYRLSVGICLIGLLMSSILTGCGATPNRMTHLRDSLRIFNSQVRWEQWGGASTLVAPDIRDAWVNERMRGGRDIKITEVSLLGVESEGPRATEAKVVVGIAYYRESDMTVNRSVWKQEWTHTADGWQLKSEERHVEETLEDPLEKPSWP